METINADKPINPIPEDIRDYSGNFDNRFSGLSKREYFAGLAMQGLLASNNGQSIDYLIHQSIKAADELLR